MLRKRSRRRRQGEVYKAQHTPHYIVYYIVYWIKAKAHEARKRLVYEGLHKIT